MHTKTQLTLKSSVITLSVFSAPGAALWPWLHIPWKCTPSPTHSLIGITSQLQSQWLSAVVLKQPTRDTDGWVSASAAQPLVPWPHLSLAVPSKTAPLQGILTKQTSSLVLRMPQSKWLALGLGLGLYLEASSLVMSGTLVWSNSSSPMPFWALPAGGYGGRSFAWWWPFSSSFPWEGAISTSYSSFFHISSALCVPFPVSPQAA